MDPVAAASTPVDPAIVLAVLGTIGALATAIGALAKRSSKRERDSLRVPPILPPHPGHPPHPSASGMIRAVNAVTSDAELRRKLDDVHRIVSAEDPETGVPRVHNKRSVEDAILESRELDQRQVELLERLCEAQEQQSEALQDLFDELLERKGKPPQRRSRPDGRYRGKMGSRLGGGE